MESQQTVMIPNDTLFSSDGRNFMVSLPVETADGAGVINVPIIFTTDGSSATELENQPVSTTVGADITSGESTGGFVLKNLNGDAKNGFFLDASQFALLSGGAEHLILTTTGNTDEGEEGSATETDPREQLLFTQTTDATDCESDGAAQTTYITSVLMPSEQNLDITLPAAHPLERVLTSVTDIANNAKYASPLVKPEMQSRKPGRPRKIVDDVQLPISKGPFRCELCNQEFSSWIQFRRHKAEHREDKPNRCPHCPRSFNLQSNLALHLSTHAKGPPWQCPECFRSFSRLASLKAHTMVHELEENLFCEQCGEECISQVQLDRHATQEHSTADPQVVHSCRHCSRDFPNKLQLKAHLMEHSKRAASLRLTQHRKPHRGRRTAHTHACKICDLAFNKPSQLIRHLRIHTGEKPYGCDECGYRFTQKGSLQIHMLKHRGCRPYCCNFCPATFTQRGNLRSHIARVHIMPHPGQQVYQCQQCTCVFRKVGSLNAHVSRLHSRSAPQGKQTDITSKSSLQSKATLDTSRIIQTQVSVNGHNILVAGDNSDILQQAIHKSGLQQPGAREENHITEVVLADSQGDGTTRRYIVRMRKQAGMRWHQCIYCTKEFKKPSDLIRHMRTHTNEKPYSCEICHRSFAVKSTLNAHMHTHTQERSYICNVCQKRYASASSLGVHMRLHLGIKPFACETCGRRFRTTGNRAAHQCESARRERAEKRKQQIAERREMREQIRDGSFPFLQDPLFVSDSGITVVSKKKGALPDESDIGQMIRPFVCVECGCRFKKSSHLKQHEVSHKGVKSFSCNICHKNFVSAGVIKAHMQTHEKSRKFKCDDCGQLYSTKGSLKRHLASHSSRKPYVCPYCHRDFKTSSNCRKHIRVHAKEVLSGIMEPNTESTSEMMRQMEQELPTLNSTPTTTELPADVQLSQKSTSHSPKLKEDLKQTSVIISGSVLKKTGNISDSGLGLLTQENIPTLEENINQQLLSTSSQPSCSGHVMDLQHSSQPTSSMGDIVIPSTSHTNSMPISLQDQSILTLGQSTGSDLKAAVDFPPLLTEQTGVLGSGPGSGLVTVESVYIQGFDGQALDTTLFSGGIPIQTDPIEMGVLSNILASASSHADPNTEDEPSRFSCERCKEGFISIESLRQHASEEHSLACAVCHERFDSQGLLEHHLASHSKQKTATRKNECQICKLAFRTPKQLAIHKSRAHRTNRANPTLAPATERPLPSLSTTAEHLQSRRKGSKATQVSEEEVTKALQLGLQEPSLSEQVFLASVQERERLSSIKETNEYNPQITPKYANACTLCPKSFKKPSDMVRHMRTHTGERPFVCSQCGKGFTVKSTLVAHFATHRKDASSGIPCHLCGSTFATKGSLRVHMRIHTGVKPLKCPHCDMSFRTSGHRKAHILSAHRIQTQTNKRDMESQLESEVETDVETSAIDQPMQEEEDVAPESEEPETSSENLQLLPIQLETTELIQLDENLLQQLQAGNFILHSADSEGTIRFEVFSEVTGQQVIGEISTDTVVDKSNDATSEEAIVNSKQCATCGKSFAKPSQLLRHIRIHTGDKPFPCMICPKRFNQKNALNTHLLMHTGHKPHQCSYCNKFFTQAGNLRTHVRRAHPEIHQLTMKSKQ